MVAKQTPAQLAPSGGYYRILNKDMPKKPKTMTGTRLSKVLGLNKWASPFQAWCEIMRVAEPPFEGNKYTEAGKAIEPKLLEYARKQVSPYIQSPEDYYCETDLTWVFNYFDDDGIFTGMWDGLAFASHGVTEANPQDPIAIIECKTTSRPQDWEDGVPDNYAIQGLLYAELMGITEVYFPVAFLEQSDYENPEAFVCTDENTRIYHLNTDTDTVDGKLIIDHMYTAAEWWETYVENGVSPKFDERKDAEYIALIHRVDITDLDVDTYSDDLDQLLKRLDDYDCEIERVEIENKIPELRAARKDVNKQVQSLIKPALLNSDGNDSVDTDYYLFTVGQRRSVDYNALEADGLMDKYVTLTPEIRTKRK